MENVETEIAVGEGWRVVMRDWTMQHKDTGEVVRVPPHLYTARFKDGYRPIADRVTAVNDYQSKKKRGNSDCTDSTLSTVH